MPEYLAMYHISYSSSRRGDGYTGAGNEDQSEIKFRKFGAKDDVEAIRMAEGEISKNLLRKYSGGILRNIEVELNLVLEARVVKDNFIGDEKIE